MNIRLSFAVRVLAFLASLQLAVGPAFAYLGPFDFSKLSNSDVGRAFGYSNTQALTFATVGAGEIRVRDYVDYDFSALNRDIDNMQRVTSHKEFRIEIPGVNLKRWTQQVQDTVNLIEAVTTDVPDQIKAEGKQAVDQYRDLIFQGATPQEAVILVTKPEFRRALDLRRQYEAAVNNPDGLGPNPSALLLAVAKGEKAFWDASRGKYVIESNCGGYTGPTPCRILVSGGQLSDQYSADDVRDFYITAFDALADANGTHNPEAIELARLAAACLAQVAIETLDPGVIAQARAQVGAEQFNANLRAAGVDHYRFATTERLLTAVQEGDAALAAQIRKEISDTISSIGENNETAGRYGSPQHAGLNFLWQAANYVATELAAGRTVTPPGYLGTTSGGSANPLGGWVQGVYARGTDFTAIEAVVIVPGVIVDRAITGTWEALGIVNPRVVLDEYGREMRGVFADGSTRTLYQNPHSGEYYWYDPATGAGAEAIIDDVLTLAGLGSTSVIRGGVVAKAPKRTLNGIWDQGRFTPIQRGNTIEDHLAGTDYSGWTRVGSQNNGFSPAWDFNQGSTWVSLKTVDTTGRGWQSSMRSHIEELGRWSSPTTPNSTRMLDIRVQPGGADAAQSLVDYGADFGVLVRINEF